MTAGDTLFAVSLAGSLFFSISPRAAKDKVLLYLLLTMAPFAVVAPALGPLIDRSRGARRAMVVTSALGRALLCPFLARDIHTLLLFPEAFLMLVLSKVYLVTKGAIVPEIAALDMAVTTSRKGDTGSPTLSSDSGLPATTGPSPGQPRARRPAGHPVPRPGHGPRCRTNASLWHADRPGGGPGDRGRDHRAGPGHSERPARPPGLAGRFRRRPAGRPLLQAGWLADGAVGRRGRLLCGGGRRHSAPGARRSTSTFHPRTFASPAPSPAPSPASPAIGVRSRAGDGRPFRRRRRGPRRLASRWPTPR